MQRHEMKARVESGIDEWKRNLDIMMAKADTATGDAKVDYLAAVSDVQKRLEELKIQAATAWDVADDTWDTTSKDLELKWDQWQLDAKKAWNEFQK